jgi:PIN domain nuclease of toxin-antitoxin system
VSFLVDTHILLWAAYRPQRLSRSAQNILDDPGVDVWFSVVNLWEVAIKSNLGRRDFHVNTRGLRQGLLDHNWRELAVSGEHVVALEDLPPLHRDPFDRLLLAQARVEGLTLVTADSTLMQYPGNVQKV